jgi:hypothetical protein
MVLKFFVDDTGKAVSKKPKAQRVSTVPVVRSEIPIRYLTDVELACAGAKGYTMIFDVESYVNYFMIGFYCLELDGFVCFEDSPEAYINLEKLNWMLWNFRLVSFNGNKYDIPMYLLALRGYKAKMLKDYTNKLIRKDENGKPVRVDWREEFGLRVPSGIDHIDIMEVCPLQGSLKKYAGRLHAKRLQDLPFEPEKVLTRDEAMHVKNYNLGSDLPATALLFRELSEQIKLRYSLNEKYGVDVRSKSDAQIAETVIKSEVKKKTGRDIKRENVGAGTVFKYEPPAFLRFDSVGMQEGFQRVKEMMFEITETGKLSMPESLSDMEMRIGKTQYKLGKGGLHSKEKCASYKAENGMMLIDIDVESFYPRLILNSGLYPEAIGPVFLEVFNELVERRLTAKKAKNKPEADGLKITINGTFGKLGSRWSIMYAPNLLIQVTLTGQLALLMLIERMEAAGCQVVSANTDGIVLHIHESQYATLCEVKNQWCIEAGLKMEETRYKALYSRDVNNYLAIKLDDSVKLKGAYSNPWGDPDMAIFRFHKNPMTTICIDAVSQMLTVGKPVEETIRECTDITKFICVRDVNGGAHKDGQFLGKVVRFYYGQDERGTINYVMNGNKVSESEGAIPLMDLPDSIPDDLDYNAYVEKANSILFDVGFYERPKVLELF